MYVVREFQPIVIHDCSETATKWVALGSEAIVVFKIVSISWDMSSEMTWLCLKASSIRCYFTRKKYWHVMCLDLKVVYSVLSRRDRDRNNRNNRSDSQVRRVCYREYIKNIQIFAEERLYGAKSIWMNWLLLGARRDCRSTIERGEYKKTQKLLTLIVIREKRNAPGIDMFMNSCCFIGW